MRRGAAALALVCALAPWPVACVSWPSGAALRQASRAKTSTRLPVLPVGTAADPLQEPARTDQDEARPRGCEESWNLSLIELRSETLRANLELRVDRLEDQASEEDRRAAVGAFEPRLSFSALASRKQGVSGAGEAPESATPGLYGDEINASLRLEQALPLGGALSLSPSLARSSQTAMVEMLGTAGLSLSLEQPLLRGAGWRPATASIRLAGVQSESARALYHLAAVRVLASAERAYWRLYQARRELEIRLEQQELARQQEDNARRLVAAGVVSRAETLRASAGLLATREATISGQAEVTIAARALRRWLGQLPCESGRGELEPSDRPSPLAVEIDRSRLIEAALAQRSDLLLEELTVLRRDLELGLAEDQRLPEINLTAGGELWQPYEPDAGSDGYHRWFLGVTGDLRVAGISDRAAVRAARLRRLETLASRDQLRLVVRQQVHDAADRLQAAYARVTATRAAAEAALLAFAAERTQFRAGERTSTDVLIASSLLADARSREVASLVDYQVAMLDLALASGTVLGHGRVRLEP